MNITEKEAAVLAKGLERLLNDRADRFGAYDLCGKATWAGGPLREDEKR